MTDTFHDAIAQAALRFIIGLIASLHICSCALAPDTRAPCARFIINDERGVGFIDVSGREVIGPVPGTAREFVDGLAPIYCRDFAGYVDVHGNLVIPAPTRSRAADYMRPFRDGVAAFVTDDNPRNWRYVDQLGNHLFDRSSSSPLWFREGLACVEIKDKWGYIDKTGKLVIPAVYDQAYPFSEGLACVWLEGGVGYIDHTGAMVIPAELDDASSFSHGLAPVTISGAKKYIDARGRVVIDGEFKYANRFHEGLAKVIMLDGRSGFIDQRGQLVIDCSDMEGHPDRFSNGLARFSVRHNDGSGSYRFGFINRAGEVVIPPTFPHAEMFDNGLAYVWLDENCREAYINTRGEVVWSEE